MLEVEGGKSVKRELPTEYAVSKFCLSFPQFVLQLLNRETPKIVEIINQLVSGATFDAEEPCRHVRGADDCKRLLEDSRDEALAAGGLTKHCESWKPPVSVESSSVQDGCFGGSLETDDSGLVTRRVFELTG